MSQAAKGITILIVLTAHLILSANPALADSYTYPVLTSNSAVLMDANTGQVLFEKNMNKRQYPASITKVMTALIALEKGNLDDIITMSNEAVFSVGRSTSHIALDVGEELNLEHALYAISISSANDAANGIAEYISGDLESFARLMNQKAVEVGAINSNFVNAHGLPNPNQYTTAYDMAKIMLQAIKNNKFLEIFSEIRYMMPPTNKQPEPRYFNSSNPLLNGTYMYKDIIASKRGWTSQAGYTLVTAAKQGNRNLIVVVMKGEDSDRIYDDTLKLLDYGFQDFLDITFSTGDLGATVPLESFDEEKKENINIYPVENVTKLLHKSLSIDDIETSYNIINSIENDTAEVKISFNLKRPSEFMYNRLGEIHITFAAKTPVDNKEYLGINKKYLWVGLFFVGISMSLFIIRRKVRRKRLRFKNKYYRRF